MNSNLIPIPLTDVGCQDLITNRNVVHHGNLRRRRMLNNLAEKVNVKTLKLDQVIRWRQSYVVLMNGCIYIYNNEMSSKPARAASLYGFTGVEACDHEVPVTVSWPFKLVSALENKDHCYYFSAPSKKDLQNWIKCIQDQLANIFKLLEGQGPSQPFASNPGDSKSSRPPLPPPRSGLPGAEYFGISDEEEEEKLDYTEIIEDEMDDVVAAKSDLQHRFTNVSNLKGRLSQIPGPQTQLSRRSLPYPSDNSSNVPQKLPSPLFKLKPAFTKSSSSTDVGLLNKEESMVYVGAPCYLELDTEPHLKKPQIESEAFWDGQQQDADLIMRHISHNGAYMLRESSVKGSQTLLVRLGSSVVKYKIQVDDKGRLSLLTAGPFFDTVASLITYYRSNPVPKHNLPLTVPYTAVEKSK